MRFSKKLVGGYRGKAGATLLETVVALAILGTIAVVFLGGMIGTTKAASLSDEQTTAESLAQSQMEWTQNATYAYGATQYSTGPLSSGRDYIAYSANITVQPLNNPDNGIQKITVAIQHSERQ